MNKNVVSHRPAASVIDVVYQAGTGDLPASAVLFVLNYQIFTAIYSRFCITSSAKLYFLTVEK